MASPHHEELRAIRQVLEGLLSRDIASAILFEALGQSSGKLPEDVESLVDLVRGPMLEAAIKRVGDERGADAIKKVVEAIRSRPSLLPPAKPMREREPTAIMPISLAPAVVVLSDGPGLLTRMVAAIGSEQVTPIPIQDVLALIQIPSAPAIVMVDATDPPGIEPRDVAMGLSNLPDTTTRVVWGWELPYGASVLEAMEKAGVEAVALRSDDGVDPLLDLIRARRKIDPIE